MKHKYKKILNSLQTKLIFIICLVLVPINLLLIYASNRMILNVQRELVQSYENELAIYMTRIDDDLMNIDKQIKTLMGENWSALSENSKEKELTRYQFWKKLQEARGDLELADAAYLKTNWDDWTVITYDGGVISYTDEENLKQFLEKQDMEAYHPYQFEVVNDGMNRYLVDNVNYSDYSFGFLIHSDTILKGIRSMSSFPGEHFYLTDKNGTIVSEDLDFSIELGNAQQNVIIDGETQKYMVISYPSAVADYYLVRVIPYEQIRAAIPQLERVIQTFGFLCLLLIPVMIIAIRTMVIKPLNKLKKGMHEVENENLDYRLAEEDSSSEFKHINHVFNSMVSQISDLKIEAYETDIEKLKMETTNLRLQINPHLLLNSLNMIYSLAQSKNYDVITKYTMSLVQYFRYSLRSNDELVPLGAELQFVKNYLDIQKIRFPGTFTHVYEMDEDLDDALIPPLLIQNFVENSIKYALKMGEEIEIIVIAKNDGEKMSISILDTGNGIKPEVLEQLRRGEKIEDNIGTHIGIWNCRKRLKLFYGEDTEMTISSAVGEGTQVWMKLPIVRKNKDRGEEHEFINRG